MKVDFTKEERRVIDAANTRLKTVIETILGVRGIADEAFIYPDLSGFELQSERASVPVQQAPMQYANGKEAAQ